MPSLAVFILRAITLTKCLLWHRRCTSPRDSRQEKVMAKTDLQNNEMMSRLVRALERGEDIGHYGRLVFTMVGRHFLDDDELIEMLLKSPNFDEQQARGLLEQCRQRDYNPPRAEKIRQWQQQ